MHYPFKRRQLRQNARFLAALRKSGNVRLAARELGVNRSTFTKRRARCAAFAALWEEALAEAHSRFEQVGGARPPEGDPGPASCPDRSPTPWVLRTSGGEPAIVRTGSGRLQVRLAPPGRMTRQAWELLLHELGDSNNLHHSAAAAGLAHSTVIARTRGDRTAARRIAGARARAVRKIKRGIRAGQDGTAPYWPPGLTIAQALRFLQRRAADARAAREQRSQCKAIGSSERSRRAPAGAAQDVKSGERVRRHGAALAERQRGLMAD